MDAMDAILRDTILLRDGDFATDDSQESLLLKLPSELRNDIYTHVAIHEAHLTTKSGDPPGILYVNRQVRSEFKAIYCSNKVVVAELWDADTQDWTDVNDPELLLDILVGNGVLRARYPDDAGQLKRWTSRMRRLSNSTQNGILYLAYDCAGEGRFFELYNDSNSRS